MGFVLRRPESDAVRLGRPALIGNVPSFCYENGWLNCDFQHGYMRRAVEYGDTTISPKQEAALGAFVAISNHPDVMLKMMLKPGDFQFINNRTILHGRAAFEDHGAKDQRRHLYRLWINVPEGRACQPRKAHWWPPTWRAGMRWRRSIARRHRPGRPDLAGAKGRIVDFIWLYRRFPRILEAITIVRPERIGVLCSGA
jgi:hypothetical protein